MAEMRGPLEVKSFPLERMFGPWMRVGWTGVEYGHAPPHRCLATYSSTPAAITQRNEQ